MDDAQHVKDFAGRCVEALESLKEGFMRPGDVRATLLLRPTWTDDADVFLSDDDEGKAMRSLTNGFNGGRPQKPEAEVPDGN